MSTKYWRELTENKTWMKGLWSTRSAGYQTHSILPLLMWTEHILEPANSRHLHAAQTLPWIVVVHWSIRFVHLSDIIQVAGSSMKHNLHAQSTHYIQFQLNSEQPRNPQPTRDVCTAALCTGRWATWLLNKFASNPPPPRGKNSNILKSKRRQVWWNVVGV